jgi:anti-sigma-K factor RskA
MNTAHAEQALAAAYVLGALDSGERREFEAHLRTCSICTDEVRSLSRVTDALAQTVPQRTPPAALRSRVLNAAAPGVLPAAEPAVETQLTTGSRRWWLLAAGIVIAVGLGAYALELQGRIARLEARLQDAERRAMVAEGATIDARRVADRAQDAMAVLAAPDLVRIDLAGETVASQATARALWSRNRGMVFTASNLPAAPEGRVYQVWVVTETAPVSAGLLSPDSSGRATAFFMTPEDIAPPVAVAVTLEPAGGVPAPTGARYLIGRPL